MPVLIIRCAFRYIHLSGYLKDEKSLIEKLRLYHTGMKKNDVVTVRGRCKRDTHVIAIAARQPSTRQISSSTTKMISQAYF